MKKKLRICAYALIFISLTLACSNKISIQSNDLANSSTNSQDAKVDNKRIESLRNQIEQIATSAGGRVGVAAIVLETGESISLNADEHFPMQSVYKLPIAMAVLRQVDLGKINLSQRVRIEKSDFVGLKQHSPVRDKNPNGTELSVGELLRFMVSESDGTACDVLLKIIGGTKTVSQYLNELQVNDMVVANTEKEIGQDWKTQYRNWASPKGAIDLLSALHVQRGLSEPSRSLLLKLMIDSPTGAKRLKGHLPAGSVVAHKTGTSGTLNGITAATNDIGLITLPNGRQLAIAVFVADSPSNETTREEVIGRIAQVVSDELAK